MDYISTSWSRLVYSHFLRGLCVSRNGLVSAGSTLHPDTLHPHLVFSGTARLHLVRGLYIASSSSLTVPLRFLRGM